MKTLWVFLHKTSKIFIPCQIHYPEGTSKGAGLIRRAVLTLTHASNMLRNFQSSGKGFNTPTSRNGSVSSVVKSPLWNPPAYLGRFNWDGNVIVANVGIKLFFHHLVMLLCDRFPSFYWYQISLVPDMSDAAGRCLHGKGRCAGTLGIPVD